MKSALIIAIMLLTSFPAFAQYETLTGIEEGGMEYAEYKACVDSCSQCETNCKTNAYRRAAETQQKEDFCNYLPEAEKQGCKNRIYMARAITSKDSAECNKITENNEKKGCLLNVQTEKAIASENEAECNSLEDTQSCKEGFNMRMAMAKSDKSYCGKLSNEAAKDSCISSVSLMAQRAEIPASTEEASQGGWLAKNKSLITYGIIILGVIIIAIVIIRKVGGKKAQPAPLFVQQQKFAPLLMQQPQIQQGEKR